MVCTQFIRVYDLSTNAAAPVHTFYLPATAEDASNDGAGSSIRDVEFVPPRPPPDSVSALSGEAAAEGWGAGTSVPPPALLGTAIILTGGGRLYAKGIPAPSSDGGLSGGGGSGGGGAYAHDGEIRHKLVVPLTLEEAQPAAGGEGDGGKDNCGGAGGSGAGGTSGGAGGGGDNAEGDADGDNGSESDGSRGRSESVGGSGREEDEEVESPVSGSAEESPSYSSYLQAFAGCDFDDVVEDSPDDSLIFAEPGLRRRGAAWPAGASTSAVPSSSAASEAMSSEADRILAMSPAAHLARTAASETAATTAAASAGALHFSHRMDVLVVARGSKSTLCLRLRGTGATTAVTGGFVLLPRSSVGSSGGDGGRGSAFVDVSATPTSQGVGTDPTPEGAASAAAKVAAMNLEAKSCLPPYTRFLDYWDGAGDLAGEDGTAATTLASAALVCVAEGGGKIAAGGGKVKSDRVLAMKIGGGTGDRRAVSFTGKQFPRDVHPPNESFCCIDFILCVA